MKWFKYVSLMVMLLVSITMRGQYNPTNPAEPGSTQTLTLKATPATGGSFSINSVTNQIPGNAVRVRAYSNSNYTFKCWEVKGEVISTDVQIDYVMPAQSTTLVAHFEYNPSNPAEPPVADIPQYRAIYVGVSPDNSGSFNITSGNRYEIGSSVELRAYNNTNFSFKNWTEDGEVISTSASFNYVMKDADAHLVANFVYAPSNPAEPSAARLSHTLSLQCNPVGAGSFNISNGNRYKEGESISLYAYSNQYYTFQNWSIGDSVISTSYNFTYVMPTHDVMLTANYTYYYNPNNPNEPGNADTHTALYGMTESVIRGQNVLYPIFLENTSLQAKGFVVDVQFPEGFVVDKDAIMISGRGTDHELTVTDLGGNNYRLSVVGAEPISDTNGKVLDIPVTIPTDAEMGKTYLVDLTHGVLLGTDDSQTPISVRDGGLLVEKISEDGLYARFSFDKYQNRVKFANLSSDKALRYEWDFGDGTKSTEASPMHIYATSGVYTATLTVFGETDTDIAEMSVLINDENNWKAQGTYYLSSVVSGVRYFSSVEDLFNMLKGSTITGDVRVAVESGQSFVYDLTSANLATIEQINNALVAGNYTLSFEKLGVNRNPVVQLGQDMTSYSPSAATTIFALGANLKLQGIEFRLWGILWDFSKFNQDYQQEVCSGEMTNLTDFSLISPDLTFIWNLGVTPPAGISGFQVKGERTLPAMSLVNEQQGAYDLVYEVKAFYQGVTFHTFDYHIIVNPALIGLFGTFSPLNNAMLETPSVTLTWESILNATYDVYLWNAKNDMPSTPVASNITNMRYTSTNFCQHGNSYRWLVKAKNACQEIVSDTLTFRIESLPNLHVYSLDCSEPVANKTFKVTWTVQNDGEGATGTIRWNDYVWLVPDVYGGTSTEGSTLLKTVQNVKALHAGESYESSVELTLPERIYGNYYLLVTSDMYNVTNINWSSIGGLVAHPYNPAQDGSSYKHLFASTNASDNKVYEAGETTTYSDNFFYKRIEIAVPPLADLQISSITTRVLPTVDPIFTPARSDKKNVSLAGLHPTEQSETLITFAECQVPTPISAAGLRYSNGYYSGKKIAVTIRVENKGGVETEKSFRTVLYMSSSADRDAAELISMRTVTCGTSILAESYKDITFAFYLPYEWSGDTYFHAYADIDDVVYELANIENNWGCSEKHTILLTPGADFLPSNINIPQTITANTPFTVSYDVKNIGPGIPYCNNWRDEIYLSKKNTGLDKSAILLKKVAGHGWFEKVVQTPSSDVPVYLKPEDYNYRGDNYTISEQVSLGNIETGKYYIYVKCDVDDDVYEEGGEDDNTICSGEILCLAPDLSVELLSLSADSISTNEVLSIAYKVKNTGDANIQNKTLSSVLYASVNQDGANAVKIGNLEDIISIASGSDKTLRANVTIPRNDQFNGLRYIFLRANVDNAINESSTSNNMSELLKLNMIYVAEDVPPVVKGSNLCLSELVAPANVHPGEDFAFSFIATNMGEATVENDVDCEIYVSSSYKLDAAQATKLEITQRNGTTERLKTQSSVAISGKCHIPIDMYGGKKFFHFVLDRTNTLKEEEIEDNYLYQQINIEGNLPDLVFDNLSIPDTLTTSENTTITWTLKNTGSWDASASKIGVYLSKNAKSLSPRDRLKSIQVVTLAKGASLDMSVTINLLDKQSGKWYLVLKADDENRVTELNKENSIVALPVMVTLAPLPELSVSTLSTSDSVLMAGQTIHIQSTVVNNGAHATRQDKWSDVYYLSPSSILDMSKATKIGSKTHVGKLAVGQSYTNNLTFTLPQSITGSYMLFAVTDGGNAIVETNEEDNSKSIPVFINGQHTRPADLIVFNIVAPSSIQAGENMTISYDVSNIGEYTAAGELRDAIYFSEDNVWDEDDVMVGIVSGKAIINPGTSITRRVTGRITNAIEGDYYIIVRTNSTRSIGEQDMENNMGVQLSPSRLEFATIYLDGSQSMNTAGYYKLNVSTAYEGTTIGFNLSHPDNAQVGLYVSYNKVPTTAIYDKASCMLQTNEQEVLIANVKAGNYYVLAQENSSIINAEGNRFYLDDAPELPSVDMTLMAKEVHFGATSLSISEAGNGGWVSSDVKGALFDSVMDFRLVAGDVTIPAEAITYHDQTASKVTFNLNGAEVGSYDVVSELPDGTMATLPDGFKIIPGSSVGLGVKLDVPGLIRVGSYAPFSISYANGGTTDIEIRELLIVVDNGYLSPTIEGLTSHQSALHITPDFGADNRGYISIPPGVQRVANFFMMATAQESHMIIYIVK